MLVDPPFLESLEPPVRAGSLLPHCACLNPQNNQVEIFFQRLKKIIFFGVVGILVAVSYKHMCTVYAVNNK
jgi:hypothetical protein